MANSNSNSNSTSKCHIYQQDELFEVKNLLTETECQKMTARFQNQNQNQKDNPITLDNPALAKHLFSNLQSYLPKQIESFVLDSICPQIRFYHYESDTEHIADYRMGNSQLKSFYSVIIYLNSFDFKGGETGFYLKQQQLETVIIKPTVGNAVICNQDILHWSVPIIEGEKLILRADVLYRTNNGDMEVNMEGDEWQQTPINFI